MARRNVTLFFVFIFLAFGLLGCDLFGRKTESTTTMTTTLPEVTETTTLSALAVRLHQIYDMAVEQTDFDGTYDEWLETIRGPQGLPGENGDEVQLRIASGFFQ